MSNTFRFIFTLILGIAALVTVVISMVTDKTMPYLAISLACSAIANFLNCRWLKEGYTCKKNSSLEE